MAFDETEQISVSYVDDYLAHNADITHVAIVHCETTTGILNPLKDIAHIVKVYGKRLIVDAMSSFGGIPIDLQELGVDFMISSANKCIQGVPGFRPHCMNNSPGRRTAAFSVTVRRLPCHGRQGKCSSCRLWTGR